MNNSKILPRCTTFTLPSDELNLEQVFCLVSLCKWQYKVSKITQDPLFIRPWTYAYLDHWEHFQLILMQIKHPIFYHCNASQTQFVSGIKFKCCFISKNSSKKRKIQVEKNSNIYKTYFSDLNSSLFTIKKVSL